MPLKSPVSSVHIPDDLTVWQLVEARAAKFLDNIALSEWPTGKSLTYREFLRDVKAVSGALWDKGIRKGDVVLIFCHNAIQTPVMMMALLKIGAVVSLCNNTYKEKELVSHINDCSATCIVATAESMPVVNEAKKKTEKITRVITYSCSDDGCVSYQDLVKYTGTPAPFVVINPREDMSFIFFSSGTTGKPKGVIHTHASFVALAHVLLHPRISFVPVDGASSFVIFMPLFHISGTSAMYFLLMEGHTNILMQRFVFEAYLELNVKCKSPRLFIVPPVATLLVKHPQTNLYDLSAVKEVLCGAAPLSTEIEKALKLRLNLSSIKQAYGLTECLSHVATHTQRTTGSVGVIAPNTECKVLDLTTGEEVSHNKEGEILLRGPQQMIGYLNNPKATAATIDKEGWLSTGDIGYYNEDGHFYIVDRKKELIKYKGMQVAPASLEDVLLGHDAVQDAAVIGVPDEMAGELPKAFVVLKSNMSVSEQEIMDYVSGRVAPFKKLRGGVEFRQAIPKSASGKILRRLLREESIMEPKSSDQAGKFPEKASKL